MVARTCNMQAFNCCFHDIRGFLHTACKRTIIYLLVANEAKESETFPPFGGEMIADLVVT